MPPIKSARLAATAMVAGLLCAGCTHMAEPGKPLPADWQQLVSASPPPFAALYRLTCCGRGTMLAALKGDEDRLSVSITAPPGATVMNAWITTTESTVSWAGKGCRQALPAGILPFGDGQSLPIGPRGATFLLSGKLPAGTRILDGATGVVEGEIDELRLRATLAGPPLRSVRIDLGRTGEAGTLVAIELSEHHGPVPGKIVIRSGGQRLELTLVSWQTAEAPQPPGWLSHPACGEKP